MQLEHRLEVHYHLKDNQHSMDAIVRNRCEADFLAAMKYITEKLGAQVAFEADLPPTAVPMNSSEPWLKVTGSLC